MSISHLKQNNPGRRARLQTAVGRDLFWKLSSMWETH